jgi:hypothetical protein
MDIRKTTRCWMKRTQKSIVTLFGGLVVLGLSAVAQAQESPPPSSPPPATTSYSSGGGGGGAGIGVGITQTLAFDGPAGPVGQFVYDQAIWHLEGLFGFNSTEGAGGERVTSLLFGAGGWYHLARGSSSDFSLGGVLAVDTASGGGASATQTSLEPGALIRAFLTPNVALHARGGLRFIFGDTGSGNTELGLGGQVTGAFGVTYFFR